MGADMGGTTATMRRILLLGVVLLTVTLLHGTKAETTAKPMAHGSSEEDDDVSFKAILFLGECKAELKASNDDIAALEKKAPFGQTTKCLIKCVAEKFDLLKGGKIVEKEVLEWIEEDRKMNASLAQKELQGYNACKTTTGSDECDTAAKLFLCVKDFAKKNGLDLS